MSTENKTITNTSIINVVAFKYGLIAAIFIIAIKIICLWLMGSASSPVNVWDFLILFIVMCFGVNNFKQKAIDDYISFKQFYITGMLIGIVTALLIGVFIFIFTKYIDKDLIAFYIKQNQDKLKHYLKGNELQNQLDLLLKYSTPLWIGVLSLTEFALLSLFMPLLMGVFFKSERKEKTTSN